MQWVLARTEVDAQGADGELNRELGRAVTMAQGQRTLYEVQLLNYAKALQTKLNKKKKGESVLLDWPYELKSNGLVAEENDL
jgi:hypothetical protein